MTETLAPEAHSAIVGGSTAARILGCTGSVDLLAQLPQGIRNESSSYADEGTALHKIMAYLVDNEVAFPTLMADTRVDELMEEFSLKDERFFDAVVPAYRSFLSFVDELYAEAEKAGHEDVGLLVRVEQECQFPGIDGAFGTTDIIIRTPCRTVIWDWKFGAGVPVYASYKLPRPTEVGVPSPDEAEFDEFGNDQLMFYATAGRNTLPEYFEDRTDWPITVVICQPRVGDGEPSRFDTSVRQLDYFASDMVDAVEEAQSGKGQLVKGSYCRFAACKTICPLHISSAKGLANVANKLGTLRDQSLSQAQVDEAMGDGMTYGQRLGLILELSEIVEPYVAEGYKQAYAFMAEGGVVPGYKLVPKKAGHDSWIDDDKAEKFLARQGIALENRRVVKPITPAVARAQLKALGKDMKEGAKDRAILEKYVQPGSSSGSTIAPASDGRPAIVATSALVQQLADKIAAG